MRVSARRFVSIASIALGVAASGCGTGAIFFHERGSGPPPGPAENMRVFDIQCVDSFVAAEGAAAGSTVLGSTAGEYSVHCTYQGKPMPWEILGDFSAAPMASGNWDKYRAKVTEKARKKGCPAVALRTSPPTENQEGEAVGAFCVKP